MPPHNELELGARDAYRLYQQINLQSSDIQKDKQHNKHAFKSVAMVVVVAVVDIVAQQRLSRKCADGKINVELEKNYF